MREDLFAQTEEFFRLAGKEAAGAKLAAIRATMRAKPWRACIAGGFSMGKTRLLNLLLEADLFPEDVIPATTVLTEVFYNPVWRMEFAGKNGQQSFEPIRENLEKFCAGNEFSDADGVLKVGCPAAFLKPDLGLYDTPGIDDLLASRADITFDVLNECDAALIVTSGHAPLGLNERQFIESCLDQNHVPRIALVVTFLDQLTPDAVLRVLGNVKKAASSISPLLQVWCAQTGPETEICDVRGVASMRAQLRDWARSPERLASRRKRALAMAATLLVSSMKSDEAALKAISGDAQVAQEQFQRARRDLKDRAETWSGLRARFMDGGVACVDTLRAMAAQMANEMRSEQARAACESRPRDMLREFSRKIARTAQQCLDADIEALLEGMRKNYGVTPGMPMNIKIDANATQEIIVGASAGMDWYLYQALDFLERHMDDFVIFVPLPPVGRALAREMGRRLVRLGKEMCAGGVSEAEAVSRFVNGATREITAAISEIYAQIGERTREMQLAWMEEGTNRLRLACGCDSRAGQMEMLGGNIAAARELHGKIMEEMERE